MRGVSGARLFPEMVSNFRQVDVEERLNDGRGGRNNKLHIYFNSTITLPGRLELPT